MAQIIELPTFCVFEKEKNMAQQQQLFQEDPRMEKMRKEREKVLAEQELEKSKQECSAQKEKILNKYIEFLRKAEVNPDEEWKAEMLETFLEAIIQMEDMMDTLEAVNMVTGFMGSMLSYVDETSNLMMNMFKPQQRGILASWKQRREVRKAIKGNMRKMRDLTYSMVGMSSMTQNMIDSFRVSAEKMKLATTKSREKARKRRAADLKKKGLDPNTPAPMSQARQLALERMNAKTDTDTDVVGGGTGPAPAPAPKPVGKGGEVSIDDIA